ncbi:MAG TPA: trypsin-like peptidase domain-containing protein [Pirellulales bacterium]|nr:trypsin-like peptidase domain-containing protein [Pirellulales bacterium]
MASLQVAMVALALSAGDTVLLDFYADWCAPCRQMESVVERLKAAGYPVRKVNLDQQRELASRFQVTSIPCFVLLVDGREVSRLVGGQSQKALESMFAAAGAKTTRPAVARAQSPDDDSTFGNTTFAEAPAPSTSFPSIQADPLGAPPPQELPDRANLAAVTADAVSPTQPDYRVEADAVVRRLLAASVRLKIDDGGSHSVGSGTIIDARDGEALVLTCGHVFRDSKGKGPVTVDLFGPNAPQNLAGHVLSYDLKSDVGLVSFRPGVPVRAARVATASRVTQNSTVVNIGCNHGENPTARISRITAINKFLGPATFSVAGQPDQGRSGGGLFTSDGQLIGVCNAADPSENEGLYAAIDPIHKELERMGLREMCLEPADPASGNVLAAVAVEPPSMPAAMPPPAGDRFGSGLLPTSEGASALTPQEAATLGEIGRRSEGAEVICIVRSLTDPRAKSEIIVLDRASPEFVKQLASERRSQDSRHLTSAKRPKPQGALATPRPRSRP